MRKQYFKQRADGHCRPGDELDEYGQPGQWVDFPSIDPARTMLHKAATDWELAEALEATETAFVKLRASGHDRAIEVLLALVERATTRVRS